MTTPPLLVCYGGTFDPVHNGHLAVARTVRDALSARVALVPAHDPPHKGPTRADALQRAEMLELAIADEPGLCVDRRELGRDGPSWTVDTLTDLRGELGNDAPIAWLIGADSLRQLASWHRWRSLFELAHIIAVQRPGAAIDAASLRMEAADVFAELEPRWRKPEQLADAAHGGFALVPMHGLRPESSSEIRRRISAGEPWQDWVPPAVADYIARHRLYRPAAVILATSPSSDSP
ncbi:MAG: nicotinate-nucleotide adenylyltransferase [Thermomonas sp.]